MRQACSNTVGPSPVRCSTNRISPLRPADQLGEAALALDQRHTSSQVVAVMLDQIEGVQLHPHGLCARHLVTGFFDGNLQFKCALLLIQLTKLSLPSLESDQFLSRRLKKAVARCYC